MLCAPSTTRKPNFETSRNITVLNVDAPRVVQSILMSAPSLKTSSRPPHVNTSSILTLIGRNMSAHAEKRIANKSARSTGRVLLVTDDKQPMLVEMLLAKGIEVVGVSTGT